MSRRACYLAALKYNFEWFLTEGVKRRPAWEAAKAEAARYTFNCKERYLRTPVLAAE